MQRCIYGMLADRLSFRRLSWCFRVVAPHLDLNSRLRQSIPLRPRFLLSRANLGSCTKKKLCSVDPGLPFPWPRWHWSRLSVVCQSSSPFTCSPSRSFIAFLLLLPFRRYIVFAVSELPEPLFCELRVFLISWTWPWCLPCSFDVVKFGPNSEGGRLGLAWFGLVGKGLIDGRTWFVIGVNSGGFIA